MVFSPYKFGSQFWHFSLFLGLCTSIRWANHWSLCRSIHQSDSTSKKSGKKKCFWCDFVCGGGGKECGWGLDAQNLLPKLTYFHLLHESPKILRVILIKKFTRIKKIIKNLQLCHQFHSYWSIQSGNCKKCQNWLPNLSSKKTIIPFHLWNAFKF